MKRFLYIIVLLLIPVLAKAQVFFKTQVLNGVEHVGGYSVTIKPEGPGENYSAFCTGPYRIGPGGYKYIFNDSVKVVKAQITALNEGEIVWVEVNGAPYYIKQSDLSDYGGCQQMGLGKAENGKLVYDAVALGQQAATITISTGAAIDSVLIMANNANTGVHYTFSFMANPKVSMALPFYDTVMCAGDTGIIVEYNTNMNFNTNNIFKVELSDPNGSFASPTIIGEIYDIKTGKIKCQLPLAIAGGNKYRLRITSSSPAWTSHDNGTNILISNYPVMQVNTNSPVCEHDSLHISATTDSTVLYSWKGVNNFSSTKAVNEFADVTMDLSGRYTVRASVNTCAVYDTIDILVKDRPAITATTNSPVCEGSPLELSAKADVKNTTYHWEGPFGFNADKNNINFPIATLDHTGGYTVYADLDGCRSPVTEIEARVKLMPNVHTENNGPLYAGEQLKFTTTGTEGVSYAWTGPDGFTDTVQNPVVDMVTNAYDGLFKVTVTLEGCSVSATTKVIVYDSKNYWLGPNPAKEDVTFSTFIEKEQDIPIQFINSIGQIVYKELAHVKKGFFTKTIHVSGFYPGQYYLVVTADDIKLVAKVQVER